VLFHKSLDLLRGQILAGKKHMFVKSHIVLPFFVSLSGSRRLKPLQLLLSRIWRAKKGARRDGRERRHGRRKSFCLHARHQKNATALRSAPGWDRQIGGVYMGIPLLLQAGTAVRLLVPQRMPAECGVTTRFGPAVVRSAGLQAAGRNVWRRGAHRTLRRTG